MMKWGASVYVYPHFSQTVGLSSRTADSNVVKKDTQRHTEQTGQRANIKSWNISKQGGKCLGSLDAEMKDT